MTEPPPPPPTPEDEFIAALEAFEASLEQTNFLPLRTLTLGQHVKAINRRAHLRPVVHVRWQQAVPDRDANAYVVLRTTEDPNLNGMPKVLGHIKTSLGRYLHTDFELWYHGDALGRTPLTKRGILCCAERRRHLHAAQSVPPTTIEGDPLHRPPQDGCIGTNRPYRHSRNVDIELASSGKRR